MRIVAVLLGLSVFPLIEGVCYFAGWGSELPQADPHVAFTSTRSLFELNADAGRRQVAENRRLYFAEESFPSAKSPDEFRIFVFGGSTVQGRPYSIQTSFGEFLEIALNCAAPEKTWRVVNCGGISYASYRLLPIMEECSNYEPDLFIVCTGHNEFLERISYPNVRQTAPSYLTAHDWMNQFSSYRFLTSLVHQQSSHSSDQRPILPEEVDAMLDHQGGLEAYSRASLHQDAVVAHFRSNLVRMQRIATEKGIPLIFMMPPSNLSDCPPFKSELSGSVDEETIAGMLSKGSEAMSQDPEQAIDTLNQVVAIDPQFAFAWYQLGHALLAGNRINEADQAFRRARDEDVCPLRMTSSLEESMRDMTNLGTHPLIEVEAVLRPFTRNEIPGDAILADHIHPTFRSNQRIAVSIVDELMHQELIRLPNDDWKDKAQSHFSEHLQSLDDMYFLRGQRTLDSLQAWTQGRADGPPLVEHATPEK